jgi:hypothetical protein
MESPDFSDMDDIELLRFAINRLLKRACSELNNEKFTLENSVFGKAAPIATLAGAADLVDALGQVKDGSASPETLLALSETDLTLVKSLAQQARQRHFTRLPAPTSK